jgi:sugar lactone lactonase YvrE
MDRTFYCGAIWLAALLLAACSGGGTGRVSYVTGVTGPEDLVAVPGTRWIITSGLKEANQPGALWLIDREARTAAKLFPGSELIVATHSSLDPACTNPIDSPQFSAHGLSLHLDKHMRGRLLVMNHGAREAIEIFAVDASTGRPRLTWTGCVLTPKGALGNGVAALPDGGLAATLMNAPEYFTGPADAAHPENWVPKLSSGQTTGYAATWRTGEGWRKIAGTEGSGPNGIEASPDGKSVWVALWGNRKLVRAPLGGGAVAEIATDFMPDNLRWGDDGRLWVAGAAGAPAAYFACWATKGCRNDYALAHVDPATLALTKVPHPKTLPVFGEATAVLKLGDEAWIGANPSDRVAVLRLKD